MDNYVLYGPGGASPVNLGSWVQADPGPDFGAKDLVKAMYSETAAADGGMLSFERAGVRRMAFPLLLASGGAGLGLASLESLLRLNARPGGAYVDLQPAGVPSAEAVRFDVLAGRWEPGYEIRHQPIGVRRGTLELDVQPYGYWPTWITLASVVSALPYAGSVSAASILGDVPGLGQLVIQPTVASHLVGETGSWTVDLVGWSVGRYLGTAPAVPGGKVSQTNLTATVVTSGIADPFAGNQVLTRGCLETYLPASQLWTRFARWEAQDADTLRGNYRLWAWLTIVPSQQQMWQVSADVIPTRFGVLPLASAAPIATLMPNVGSHVGTDPLPWGPAASPAYQLLDLGPISMNTSPSGMYPLATDNRGLPEIRLWIKPASGALATTTIRVGGMLLQQTDGPHGVLPAGLVTPTAYGASTGLDDNRPRGGRLVLDTDGRRTFISDIGLLDQAGLYAATDLTAHAPIRDARPFYRGDLPMIAPATSHTLTVFAAGRKLMPHPSAPPNQPPMHSNHFRAAIMLRYRPRFQFLKGL